MTRGQDGSLCLSCVTLSFTTPRRFYPGARHGLLSLNRSSWRLPLGVAVSDTNGSMDAMLAQTTG
jgi:hypothetical protein